MYQPQVQEVLKQIFRDSTLKWHSHKLKISTVDSFQGSESDYIIISTVRSNSNKNLGFLENQRRVNVAISRAKKGLVMIGNNSILRTNVVWSRMINMVYEKPLVSSKLTESTSVSSFSLSSAKNSAI